MPRLSMWRCRRPVVPSSPFVSAATVAIVLGIATATLAPGIPAVLAAPSPVAGIAAATAADTGFGGLAALGEAAFREGEVLLPRHPAPSPDGTRIAFCWQGDLWIVASEGGEARRLSAHPAIESYPVWSRDGRWIAFSSDRSGNDDVFALPLDGGPIRQLTFDSDADYASDWTPDGRAVLVHSRRHVRDGRDAGLWWVPLDGGMAGWIQPVAGESAVLSPDGTRLAFVRGSTEWTRRGYEGEGRNRLFLHELGSPLIGSSLPEIAEAGRRDARGAAAADAGRRVAGMRDGVGGGVDAALLASLPPDEVHTQGGWLAEVALRPHGVYVELTALAAERGTPRSQQDRTKRPDFARPDQEFGANAHPAWFPDGEHLLYLSEIHGVANIKVLEVTTGSRAWITRFENGDGRLRHPALSRDGSLAVFEYEDGIYAVDLPAALPESGSRTWPTEPPAPRRIPIRLPLDERIATVADVAVNGGADELALSPNGEQLAFVVAGDIFARKAGKDEPWAYPLSVTPARDQEIDWAPDSKSLVFVSDRAGNHDLWVLRSTDPDEPRLARSLHLETVRLTSTPQDEHAPRHAPDGSRLAFRRDKGTLVTMRPDGSDERVLVEGWSDLDFSWSPDGKWIAYAQEDADFNSDIFLVPADGSAPPYNLTRHPDNEGAPSWSADGRILAFVSGRRFPNEEDVWYVRLTREDAELSKEERLDRASQKKKENGKKGKDGKDAKDGKGGKDAKEDDSGDSAAKELPVVRIDFDGLHERIERLTSLPGSESRVWVTPDGDEFVFSTDTDGNRDLWKVRWDGEELTRLTKGGADPRAVQFDAEGKKLWYLESGKVRSVGLDGGDGESYPFEAEVTIDRFARRQAVFDEAWREIGSKFYDPGLHGADWERIGATYRGWAGAASTYRDFHDVLKMMLGEVGASHMSVWGGPGDWVGERFAPDANGPGIGAVPEGPWDLEGWGYGDAAADRWNDPQVEARDGDLDARSAELGVFFDPTFAGPGLRVAVVVPKGPATRVESRIEAGEILLALDGVPLGPAQDPARLLDRRDGRPVALRVRSAKGEERDATLRPIGRSELRRLLYDAVVALRQEEVARRTDGRVAYIHIESMDVPSLETFERDLYAQAHGKDALIIDVRDNGGGWTTDFLLASLEAPDHATTVPRDGTRGYPQDRRLIYAWTRPVVVLCNEHSYSNAEIFSWAIQATGRGPVVGMQTYGAVISTGGMYLGDRTWLRLPFRGWYSQKDGTNMEAQGCLPDVVVDNDPGALQAGRDPQLAEAIRLALAGR